MSNRLFAKTCVPFFDVRPVQSLRKGALRKMGGKRQASGKRRVLDVDQDRSARGGGHRSEFLGGHAIDPMRRNAASGQSRVDIE